MSIDVTQRNSTRNQSTADFEQKKIFLFDNRFSNGTLKNLTDPATDQTIKAGQLLFRASTGELTIVADANYAKLVGVLAIDGQVILDGGDSLEVTYCDKGTIDGGNLVLPGSDTLTTLKNGLTVKDHLQRLGIHVEISTEMTSFDN